MKTSIKLFLICSIVCLVTSVASAQQKAGKKPAAARPVCKVESVPAGMVIVSHKANSACTEGFEFVVKKPVGAELVCANSPIPDGFVVEETAGSPACGGENPLTNAFKISTSNGFYGLKIGITGSDVWAKWGRPLEIINGKAGSPSAKGLTWRYRSPSGNTIYLFMDWSPSDSEYKLGGFEEIKPRS